MTLVFAHRGGPIGAQENTLAAFRAARARGAQLESDVWLTADGVPVLDHDGRVRTRGRLRRQPIAALDRAELSTHVPSLPDLYAACGHNFELALDVCDPAAAAPTAAAARTAGRDAPGRLWLCGPDPETVASWRDHDPYVRLVLSQPRWLAPGESPTHGAERLAALGLTALNLPRHVVTAEIVAACHDAGLLTIAWGVETAQQAGELAAAGADAVMGDDVQALLDGVSRAE